ncbi:hypothetical protein MACK_001073 [Theileria orientalis]|uniref:Uncharacterized protein n=1 Tax=Theileria orientalis TaxID=68886 RepID=A0A976QX40_THEOR|nr:hypothetical protein MACK_001073 [Theileria orientalis]
MKVITIYLLILALIVRTEALNAKMGEKSIKSMFKKAKHRVKGEWEFEKAKVNANVKANKEAEKHRRKVLKEEMSKLNREKFFDQYTGDTDLERSKKYHLVGSSDLQGPSHRSHKVDDNDLKALQLELEKKVVNDIDQFVQKVGAY